MKSVNGYVISHMPECSSTSDMLKDMIASEAVNHGYILRTDYQEAGHGQAGNKWESERGKNLLFSIGLDTSYLRADEQAYFNFATTLAVADTVKQLAPSAVWIKWPNDIYVDTKKVAGILIENTVQGMHLKHTVAGIGLNVNQRGFKAERAVSLAEVTGRDFNIDSCMETLLHRIHVRHDELRLRLKRKLSHEYQALLYLRDKPAMFRIHDKEEVQGIIKGVDESGRLCLMVGETMRLFNKQEIVHLHR